MKDKADIKGLRSNPPHLSDDMIVALYFERNERAIKETDVKYGKYLYTIAYNIVYNQMDCEECLNDTSLWIPATVKGVSGYAFRSFQYLSTITVDSQSTTFYTVGNALVDRATGFVVLGGLSDSIPTDSTVKGVGSTVEIPVGVVAIADNTCAYNEQLIAVAIPNTVTSIGREAFTNCSNLAAVDVPSSVKSIGENAFVYCTSITSFVLHSGLESIGGSALRFGTSNVTVTLPDTLM